MKTYSNDKSRPKHSDAAASGSKSVATKDQEEKHEQYSMRTRSSSQKDNTPEQNHNEPNIIKTLSQTGHCKKGTHRSSLAKIRKKRVRSTSSSSGKYIRQRKRMESSSDDEEVTIQTDSDSSDDSVENVNGDKKKRGGNKVRGNGQNILSDAFTPAKPSVSRRGKYIRQRKRRNEEDVSIQIDSDSADAYMKNIKKKKKKRGSNIVHKNGQGIQKDGSASAKLNASSSGKYLAGERKRMDNSSADEVVSIQTGSDSFDGAGKTIRREKKNEGGGNIVQGDDQDVLEDDSTLSKSNASTIRQRKRSLTDEEEASNQTDSELFGGTAKNIKKKRRLNSVQSHEDVLAEYIRSLKSSASGSAKYLRTRSGDSSDEQEISIQTDSDPFGGAVENIKREKKNGGGENIVHVDDKDVLDDGSTLLKSNASTIGNYIRQRKRKRNLSDKEEASNQTDSDLFGGTAKNIRKKRRVNSVQSHEDVLAEYITSLKSSASDSGKNVRKQSDVSSDEEEVSIPTDSDSTDGSGENIKKKKKRGGKIGHGDDHNTFVKPKAFDSGRHIRQRKRSDDSSDDEDVSIQNDSKLAKGGASGTENCIQQRKRCDDSSDEKEIIIQHQNLQTNIVDGESQNILPDGTKRGKFLSDFDFMRERKKAENAHRRKRNRDCDSNQIEALVELLDQMKQAAIQDRQLNLDGQPATKKIAILHTVMQQLIKKDLQHALLSHNVLHVLAEWIAPLPNKALPCLQIRESILKLLADFPTIDKHYLKESGIGKAVMYLYKHPGEIKANRKRAYMLITGWCRSVYNIRTNFNAISLEERRQLDLQHLPNQPKPPAKAAVVPSKAVVRPDFWLIDTNSNTIRPGEKGWISRARVPLPSNKVYIVRPESKIETSPSVATKQQPNRYEMYLKKFNYNKRKSTARSPVQLSIAGTKCCDF